jgi:hypothetical protein
MVLLARKKAKIREVSKSKYIENEWANPDDHLIDKRFKLLMVACTIQVVGLDGFPLTTFPKT